MAEIAKTRSIQEVFIPQWDWFLKHIDSTFRSVRESQTNLVFQYYDRNWKWICTTQVMFEWNRIIVSNSMNIVGIIPSVIKQIFKYFPSAIVELRLCGTVTYSRLDTPLLSSPLSHEELDKIEKEFSDYCIVVSHTQNRVWESWYCEDLRDLKIVPFEFNSMGDDFFSTLEENVLISYDDGSAFPIYLCRIGREVSIDWCFTNTDAIVKLCSRLLTHDTSIIFRLNIQGYRMTTSLSTENRATLISSLSFQEEKDEVHSYFSYRLTNFIKFSYSDWQYRNAAFPQQVAARRLVEVMG